MNAKSTGSKTYFYISRNVLHKGAVHQLENEVENLRDEI